MPVKEENDESESELLKDLEDLELEEGIPDDVMLEGEKPSEEGDEGADEDEAGNASLIHPKISKTLLIVGVILSVAGLIGVIGLRVGIIQQVLFGNPNPYPGIGHVEVSGHVVSLIPFVLGLVTVFVWGIKNNPIYYEMQKHTEEELMLVPVSQVKVPDEFLKPLEDMAEEQAAPAPAGTRPLAVEEAKMPEEERVAKCEKMLGAASILAADRGRLRALIHTGIGYQDYVQEVMRAVERKNEEDKKLAAERKPGELDIELVELEKELAEPTPLPPPKAPKDKAEQERISRCEKMLAVANILPDDRTRLRKLIPTGINAHDFTEEVKKAIDRKKKKEEEKKLTADEKASLLEEELAAELEDLESALGKDKDDDEDMEEKILKEIEDLENL